MTKIELQPVAFADKSVLREFLNLYLYDFSELDLSDPNEHGRFEYRWLDHYWTEEGRFPFFILADGLITGFTLVRALEDGVHSIAEFFVLKRHRRQGIGAAAARASLREFPGWWMVSTQPNNTPAQAFWRHVMGEVVDGRFEERMVEHAWGEQPTFFFELR